MRRLESGTSCVRFQFASRSADEMVFFIIGRAAWEAAVSHLLQFELPGIRLKGPNVSCGPCGITEELVGATGGRLF
jgi:hypothetical protein